MIIDACKKGNLREFFTKQQEDEFSIYKTGIVGRPGHRDSNMGSLAFDAKHDLHRNNMIMSLKMSCG